MRTIKLNHVTKIEGHAKLHIVIDKNNVKKAQLKIYEGSRFFEGILKNRKYNDINHIASRICGVCSVVHNLAALRAIENAFKVEISEQTNELRELLNIAGMIQSHVLHLYFLALPDYFNCENAIELASKHKEELKRALSIKKTANSIVRTIGGRDVHPIASVPGGFSRLPKQEDMHKLLKQLILSKRDAKKTVDLFASLDYPEFKRHVDYFALSGGPYFYSENIIRCEEGECFLTKDYDKHFKEYFRKSSTAEFATKEGKSYTVGAFARVLANKNLLKNSKEYIKMLEKNKCNPFYNNLAQAVEIYEGFNRAIEIIENLKLKNEALPKIKPIKSTGIGAIEAPRGMLFHKYSFDDEGICTSADITTPTTQNLADMENSIKQFTLKILNKSKDQIKLEIERLIRAYDPCISCSTHFLELKLERN